jgi:hypothetical protein
MIYLKHYYWWLPLCFYSLDANAWGLMTHVYFAHSLLWAMPLLDPRLQKVIKQFPELVMSGACLPDLTVVSEHFSETHQWHLANKLLASAKTDEETALAIGFASHLYVDVIAHNHFVPAHEASWFQSTQLKKNIVFKILLNQKLKRLNPLKFIKISKWFTHSAMTHITSEWAMDAHLTPLIPRTPSQLLIAHQTLIVRFITPHFRCTEDETRTAVQRLSFWDGVLRACKLPHAIYHVARYFDPNVFKHFVYYIARTQNAIAHIGQALNGVQPHFEAELKISDTQALIDWREACLANLHLMHPIPINYYANQSAN